MKQIKYISDIITAETIQTWKNNQNILITALPSSGKSYFCKNVLYDYCKILGCKILYLLPRIDTILQFQEEIENDRKDDLITIVSYQTIERAISNYDLNEYAYIVADEAHYFFNDASFNSMTDISFSAIMKCSACRIFMTATPNRLWQYFEYKNYPIQKYSISSSENFVDKVTFYQSDGDMEELLSFAADYGIKCIAFINDVARAYALYQKYQEKAIFNCSRYHERYSKYRSDEEMQVLIRTGKFNKQLLITTTALDVGFSIVDEEVNNIIIDNISDVDTIIQCAGRKRKSGKNDHIFLYIREFSNKNLRGKMLNLYHKTYMANYLKDYGLSAFLKKFKRCSDKSDIIYDYLEDGSTLQKAINYIKLFSLECEILEYKSIMQIENHGFCRYVSEKLGLTNYSLYEEESSDTYTRLSKYLASIEGRPFYTNKDRQTLINTINIRRKNRLLKSATLINAGLKEMGILFKIVVYETTCRKENKKYKNAWKVVRA